MTGNAAANRQRLVLIRHATPEPDFNRPPREWPISDQGIAECCALAERLTDAGPTALYSSQEPKAAATAREVAARLGIEWHTWPGLHEHEREALPEYAPAAWHALIRRLFEHPGELVMGLETADQALARFSQAVESLLAETAADPLGIVSHGTVIALYVSLRTGEPAYDIWSRLGMADEIWVSL